MSLELTVDGPRWRAHLERVATEVPGLVPVCKGNGYGFGLARLARKAQWLDERVAKARAAGTEPARAPVDTLAVGTYEEIEHVRSRFDGSVIVLAPWRPFGAAPATSDPRVVHTVSRLEDLTALLDRDPGARFVLERRTSMLRHGMDARELREAGDLLARRPAVRGLEGVALHLPLQQGSHVPEVRRLMTDVVAAGLRSTAVWVSHLTRDELATLRAEYADHTWRPRVGTDLWLGDRGALTVTSTVLDVHPVRRGDAFGYRSRTAPRAGHLLVVSGGTAHGIGLEAPTGDSSARARAAALARGGLDAVGVVRSPFSVDGTQRRFAEPPHMQASMLFLPAGARVPEVGERVAARVRYTATTFDRVLIG